MKATEARKTATSIARAEETRKSAELQKRRAALKESIPRIRKERIAKIEARFRQRIESAVKYGDTKTEITLSSDHNDYLRGEYKYLPTKRETDWRGNVNHSWYHAWGEGYLKYAPWGKYVKLVLAKLRRDGFKYEVTGRSVEHDESSAYMNSGGECGSETPYWTRDTVLVISW